MDAFSMGLVAAMGALATVAGASEDIESDIGSQSNPNSQVQLAAQVGNPHRIYNKAISGEPPANALWAATAAMVAYTLITAFQMPALLALVAGASVAALFNGVFFLLLLFLPAYALSGALLAWFFRLPPVHAALSLVGSALPWVAWLWPATISSSGWLTSLVWPALIGAAFGLSLLGARLVGALRRRKPTQTDTALA